MIYYIKNMGRFIHNLGEFISDGEIIEVFTFLIVFFVLVNLPFNVEYWYQLIYECWGMIKQNTINTFSYSVKNYNSITLRMIVKMNNVLWIRTHIEAYEWEVRVFVNSLLKNRMLALNFLKIVANKKIKSDHLSWI